MSVVNVGKVVFMLDEILDWIEILYCLGVWWDGVFLSVVFCGGMVVFLFMLIYGWVNGDFWVNWVNIFFIGGFVVLNVGFVVYFVCFILKICDCIKCGVLVFMIILNGFYLDEDMNGVMVFWFLVNQVYVKWIWCNVILRINFEVFDCLFIFKKIVLIVFSYLYVYEIDIIWYLFWYCRVIDD